MNLVVWFSPVTFGYTGLNEDKACSWIWGIENRRRGGYWMVDKVLLSELVVLMRSRNIIVEVLV